MFGIYTYYYDHGIYYTCTIVVNEIVLFIFTRWMNKIIENDKSLKQFVLFGNEII